MKTTINNLPPFIIKIKLFQAFLNDRGRSLKYVLYVRKNISLMGVRAYNHFRDEHIKLYGRKLTEQALIHNLNLTNPLP